MPMKQVELISVAMGVCFRRQGTQLLQRAVDSILQQTHADLELLICENGSTAEAKEFLAQYAREDSRIRLIDGAGAFLLGEKLNRCIRAAKGAWIARQDDDDWSRPDRLEKQLDFLKREPRYGFVGCWVELEQDCEIVGVRSFPQAPEARDFRFVQPFIHPTLVFRKECLEAVGGYSEAKHCHGCEDYDLLLRLYQTGYRGANLPDPCFTYRLPPRGRSNRNASMRLNEVIVRWERFRSLGMLPGALPYVIKPVLVGLIPPVLLSRMKNLHQATAIREEKRP